MSDRLDFSTRCVTLADEAFLWTALYHAIHVSDARPPARDIVEGPELARYVRGWRYDVEPGVIAETRAGVAVGACWLRLLQRENAGYGYLAEDIPELSVAVLPEYRNRGIGSALLDHLIRAAEPRFRGISLSVSITNPARRLYARKGFVEISTSGDSILMARVS